MYIPGFWQVFKFAWVKYFSLVILFMFFLHYLFLNYVITENAFDTVEISEFDYKNNVIQNKSK